MQRMSLFSAKSQQSVDERDDFDDILATAYDNLQTQVQHATTFQSQSQEYVQGEKLRLFGNSTPSNISQSITSRPNKISKGLFSQHTKVEDEAKSSSHFQHSQKCSNSLKDYQSGDVFKNQSKGISTKSDFACNDKSSKSLSSCLKTFAYSPPVCDEGHTALSNTERINKNVDSSKGLVLDRKNGEFSVSAENFDSTADEFATAFDIEFDEMFDCNFEDEMDKDVNGPSKGNGTCNNGSHNTEKDLCSESGSKFEKEVSDGKVVSKIPLQNLGSPEASQSSLFSVSQRSFSGKNCSTPINKSISNVKKLTDMNMDSPTSSSSVSSFHKACDKGISFMFGSASKARKRKFPGPAGILPDIPPGADLSLLKQTAEFSYLNGSFDYCYENEFICSQERLEPFMKTPWQHMLKDLSTHTDLNLVKQFNIRAALCKASKMKLPKHFVFPMLCVLLTDISVNSNSIDAVFIDETGKICGKINLDVFKKYEDCMVPYSAIVIKRAEFLCNHLIVRSGTISAIYVENGREFPLQGNSFEIEELSSSSRNQRLKESSSSSTNQRRKESSSSSTNQRRKESSRCLEDSQNKNFDDLEDALNDDYESLFSDNMDDLLGSLDVDSSMQ